MMSYLWPEGMSPFSVVADNTKDATSSVHDMIFPTSDGYITLGAISDKEWLGLCTALNKPQWVTDERFATPAARSANRQERLECVEQALGGTNTETVIAGLEANDVPCAPVLKRRAVIDHPQVVNNDIVHEVNHPSLGAVRQARAAARFEDTPSHMPRVAPLLGEHTCEVLAEIGVSQSQCDALISAGALGVTG
jgi:crotonobetainyl-CoA:carnitine CoA-transferase CaiB-like acyl-CoA transferase